jgi:anti-sigma factor RsiW
MSGEDAVAGRESGRAAGRPPRFAPTEHLASEAIAAYVDGELRMNAYLRAAEHLAKCPECSAEVDAQQQARIALRQAAQMQISAPLNLHDTLSRIPLADLAGNGADDMSRGPSFLGLRADSFRFVASAGREFGSDSRRWTGWWRK